MIAENFAATGAIWATCWIPLIAVDACGGFDNPTWFQRARLYACAPCYLSAAAITVAVEALWPPRASAFPYAPADAPAPTADAMSVRRSPSKTPAVVAADAGRARA